MTKFLSYLIIIGYYSYIFFLMNKHGALKRKKKTTLDCSLLKKIRAKYSYKPHPYDKTKYIIFDEETKTAHISMYSFDELVSKLVRMMFYDKWTKWENRRRARQSLWYQKKIYQDFKNDYDESKLLENKNNPISLVKRPPTP